MGSKAAAFGAKHKNKAKKKKKKQLITAIGVLTLTLTVFRGSLFGLGSSWIPCINRGWGGGGQRARLFPHGEALRSPPLRTKLPGCLEATASLYTAGYFECKPPFYFWRLQCCRVDYRREFSRRNMPAHASQESVTNAYTCVSGTVQR